MRKEKAMDRNNKTDQFFREKLDQVEFQPSDQAWKMVQGTINSKRMIPWVTYFKVAASVALLLAIGLLFYPKQEQSLLSSEEITSPQPLEIAMVEVPDQIEKEQVIQQAAESMKTPIHEVQELTNEPHPVQRTVLEPASIEALYIATQMVAIEEPELSKPVDQAAVKITYYTARSAEMTQDEQDSSKVKLFDKMKFFAKNVSPVEILTDIRIAKEELIENGFKRN